MIRTPFFSRVRCLASVVAAIACLGVFSVQATVAEDVVELLSGAKARGRVISQEGDTVTMAVKIGSRTFQRKYPKNRIQSVTIDGERTVYQESAPHRTKGAATSMAGGTGKQRSRQEVLQLIDDVGRTPPDWYESTDLNYPDTLDLSWPQPPPKPWNNQKNIGQFLWDRINPNPGKWREGVKFMHHVMAANASDRDVIERAMQSLGGQYHNLHQDYARAAFWWHQAGVPENPGDYPPNVGLHLANCYYQLGNKQMALDLLKKMPRRPYATIKLIGDMGEPEVALKLAESFAKSGNAVTSYLYAGDVCRVAGRIEDAERYYRRVLAASETDPRNNHYSKMDRGRAEASLAAIQFYKLNLKTISDGTYEASSLGYEAQVQVAVTIADGRIESVEVTQHREKQFYSSLEETPRRIIDRQNVIGVDTTSSATITSEAIINATAKALAQQIE